ncbi:MAG: DUF924 domain-containing protein, partial [Halomonadaceae bacterium]|nr:DUF924 domain-containing protein [Halomonadaceae bacterium]
MANALPDRETVIAFWFEELEPAQWFVMDTELDDEIRQRFA